MNVQEYLECDRKGFQKVLNFQLPTNFNKIGLLLAVISLGALMFAKISDINIDDFRLGLRMTLLIGLLVISVSKDKEEDELIKILRAQSYAFSFISGVLYAIVQPFFNLLVGNTQKFQSLGDFQVLFFMLLIQLFIFSYLKKMR